MLEAHLVRKGSKREVFALVKRSKTIFEEDVYDGIPIGTKNRIDEYVEHIANAELPFTNFTVSRVIKGHPDIFELRPENVRILYFFFGRNIILANACKKKPKKAFQADVKRAEKLREEFLSED